MLLSMTEIKNNLLTALEKYDFFGESVPSEAYALSAQLAEIDRPKMINHVHADLKNHDFMLECSETRAKIIAKIGFGNFQKITKSERSACTEKISRYLAKIAESMNETSFLHSQKFIDTYSTSGLFMPDDIWNIVDSIPSIESTKRMIANDIKDRESDYESYSNYLSEIEQNQEITPQKETTSESQDFSKSFELWEDFVFGTEQTIENTADCKTGSAFDFESFYFPKRTIFPKETTMNTRIVLDDRQHDLFVGMLQKTPVQLKKACHQTLNTWGYEIHGEYHQTMAEMYNMRNKGLAKSNIRYDKTRIRPINEMFAEIGSLESTKKQFTGFAEQEGVAKHKRKRRGLKAGRKNYRSRLSKSARMTGKNESIEDFINQRRFTNNPRRVMAFVSRVLNGGETSLSVDFPTTKIWEVHQRWAQLNKGGISKGVWKLKGLKKGDISTTGTKILNQQRAADKSNGLTGKNSVRGKMYNIRDKIVFTPLNVEKKNGSLQPKARKPLERTFKPYFTNGRAGKVFQKNMHYNLKKIAPS